MTSKMKLCCAGWLVWLSVSQMSPGFECKNFGGHQGRIRYNNEGGSQCLKCILDWSRQNLDSWINSCENVIVHEMKTFLTQFLKYWDLHIYFPSIFPFLALLYHYENNTMMYWWTGSCRKKMLTFCPLHTKIMENKTFYAKYFWKIRDVVMFSWR